MRKTIIFNICVLLHVMVYGQTYNLNLKGTYFQSTYSNGYSSVRDAAFYNDTCYLVSGDGTKILMTKSNGVAITNYFSSITFNQALKVYADDSYVLVLDRDYLRCYSKKGVLKYSIPIPSDVSYRYFWVKNKQEIMLVSRDKILVYDYSTRTLLKSVTHSYELYRDNLRNDGNKLYSIDSELVTYEYKGGTIQVNDITTSKFKFLQEENNYLACFVGNESLWFNYFDRSQAFFVDAGFNNVVRTCNSFLPASKNPTNDELYMESGDPNLKVYYSQGKIYVINILRNKVEFYMLEEMDMPDNLIKLPDGGKLKETDDDFKILEMPGSL